MVTENLKCFRYIEKILYAYKNRSSEFQLCEHLPGFPVTLRRVGDQTSSSEESNKSKPWSPATKKPNITKHSVFVNSSKTKKKSSRTYGTEITHLRRSFKFFSNISKPVIPST
nr:uncharacterized protein LOC106679412 [Halyomorpha halys]